MSVYIKGMEMPTGCDTCPFEVFGDCHGGRVKRIMDIDEEIACGVRHKNCPLIPVLDHGRLIDADAMQEEWYRLNFDRKISDGTLAYWNYQLSQMPTIIPADKEEQT